MARLISNNNYISTDALYYGSSLAHHGIKGQKWGVRRYQNEDGTLTEAGKARYERGTYAKGLNKMDKDIASTIHKKALNDIKVQKAKNRGDIERAKELQKVSDSASKAISAGRKTQTDMVNKARKNGVTIQAKDAYRYTNQGKMIAGALLAGPIGTLPFAIVDGYRAATYGNEAGGVVRGTVYKSSF